MKRLLLLLALTSLWAINYAQTDTISYNIFQKEGKLGIGTTQPDNLLTLYGNIGIGTTNPISKLQISDRDIYISDINKGIIMKSPDG